MELFKRSAATACFLGIIFSVLSGLMPSEKLSKQMNVMFSLILMILIVTPFLNADLSRGLSDFSEYSMEDYSYLYTKELDSLTKANISEALGKILAENGIYPLKISVDTNNSADGSISIDKAEIIITESSARSRAKQLAAQALGLPEEKIEVKTEEKAYGPD